MNLNEFVIRLFFINIIYIINGAAADDKSTLCQGRASACEAGSPGQSSKRPVCGTNGRTYASRCHLIRAQCNGEPVAVARKGPCMVDNQTPCLVALRYALNAQSGVWSSYVPKCRGDGTYAPVQCASASASVAAGCWCVTPDGKPIPDTSVRNGRPDCTRTGGKSHTKRRSSTNGKRNKKSCSRTDRVLFNGNLIKIFTGEYERARSESSGKSDPQVVADWKFRELDRDRNEALQKSEYRGLRRLIKKVVKPKRCARAWTRGCDGDGDGEITHSEWVACLLVNPEPPAPDYDDGGPEPEPDYNEEEPPPDPTSDVRVGWAEVMRYTSEVPDYEGTENLLGVIVYSVATSTTTARPVTEAVEGKRINTVQRHQEGSFSIKSYASASAFLPGEVRNAFAPDGIDSDPRREEEANDCLTDRQAVLDEQKAGGAALYVPECTGDGRYARAQCYRSTGYCWCVHQDTGKPIPGSSVKDRKPDCDAAPQHASPMRGCPEPSKAAFLRDLIAFFISKMTTSINGTGPGEMVKWGASKEEQAATWTYVMLDKDKNKALERREWKAFHQMIANIESLRRCGRKLPRYCDVNHDNKISITEWMACLEVTQGAQVKAETQATKAPPSHKRKGPNPLDAFLKAD